jgi:hypothetical protein
MCQDHVVAQRDPRHKILFTLKTLSLGNSVMRQDHVVAQRDPRHKTLFTLKTLCWGNSDMIPLWVLKLEVRLKELLHK